MGKINGYSTTFDSFDQPIDPVLGVFLLGIKFLLYDIGSRTLAFGVFIMVLKKIIPLMEKRQFRQIETLE